MLGALLVLAGSAGSTVVRAGYQVIPLWLALRAQTVGVSLAAMGRAQYPVVDLALVLLAVALLIGARRVTNGGRAVGISDELRAAARLATIGYTAATTLGVVASWYGDWTGFGFFDTARDLAQHLADSLLAFVAARHFARSGLRASAVAAHVVGWAMLAAIVAQWALTRRTHDDMYFTVAPRYGVFVAAAMNAVLWLGKLLVFVRLCAADVKPRALAGGGTASRGSVRSPDELG
jgi:hypothetical protein